MKSIFNNVTFTSDVVFVTQFSVHRVHRSRVEFVFFYLSEKGYDVINKMQFIGMATYQWPIDIGIRSAALHPVCNVHTRTIKTVNVDESIRFI